MTSEALTRRQKRSRDVLGVDLATNVQDEIPRETLWNIEDEGCETTITLVGLRMLPHVGLRLDRTDLRSVKEITGDWHRRFGLWDAGVQCRLNALDGCLD